MRLVTLLLGATLASAHARPQFMPDLAQLDNFIEHAEQAQNQGQANDPQSNYDSNMNGNSDGSDGNAVHSIQAPTPTPAQGHASLQTFAIHTTFNIRPSPSAVFNSPIFRAPEMLGESPSEPIQPQENSLPVNNVHGRDFMDPNSLSGGIAPIGSPADNTLQPGNNVAPAVANEPQHGNDEGNAFCFGQCFANADDAQCQPPVSSNLLDILS